MLDIDSFTDYTSSKHEHLDIYCQTQPFAAVDYPCLEDEIQSREKKTVMVGNFVDNLENGSQPHDELSIGFEGGKS
jgi:hypothetical protein